MLFSACSQRENRILEQAQKYLANNQADSAYQLLKDTTNIHKYLRPQRMRHLLWLADAKVKTGLRLDSLEQLDAVQSYFGSDLNESNLRMKANYLLGVAYAENEATPWALYYFKQAADLANIKSEDCDFSTLWRTYAQMSQIYKSLFLIQQQKEMRQWAELASLQSGEQKEIVEEYFNRLDSLNNTNNTLVDSLSEAEMKRLNNLYEFTQIEERVRLAEQSKKRLEQSVWEIIGILVAVYIVCYSYYLWRRRCRYKKLVAVNRIYADLWKRYKDAVAEADLLQNDIQQLGKEKQEEIRQLQYNLQMILHDEVSQSQWEAEREILLSPLMQRLHMLASQGRSPIGQEWENFTRLVENNFSNFHQLINNEEYRLTEQEKMVSMLIRAKFKPSEIIVLMDISKQRITNLRASINQKLFHQKGTVSLDYNISKL